MKIDGIVKVYDNEDQPLTNETVMAKKVAFNMDVLKKHLFWICTPIGLVIAVLAGIMSIASIADDLDKQAKQLDGQRD